jgi:hypothetical protein
MANIADLLKSDLGKQIISGIGAKAGASSQETSSVLQSALPAMLGGLQKNASSGDANNILSALSTHDGSVLENVSGFLGGSDAQKDGKSILGHIFGNEVDTVKRGISEKSGVSSSKTSSIIEMAAPILMGYVGKQTQTKGVKNSNGLTDILGSLLGGSGGGNILSSLLDQNGDGKLDIADIASVVSGGSGKGKKSDGLLGGLLGGLFGKK